LKAGTNKECYDKSVFADKIFLEGIICPDSQGECEITGIRNTEGVMQGSIEADQVFIIYPLVQKHIYDCSSRLD
jgi:hypothetical protein